MNSQLTLRKWTVIFLCRNGAMTGNHGCPNGTTTTRHQTCTTTRHIISRFMMHTRTYTFVAPTENGTGIPKHFKSSASTNAPVTRTCWWCTGGDGVWEIGWRSAVTTTTTTWTLTNSVHLLAWLKRTAVESEEPCCKEFFWFHRPGTANRPAIITQP